jgi:hypothetical protein
MNAAVISPAAHQKRQEKYRRNPLDPSSAVGGHTRRAAGGKLLVGSL